MFSCIGWCSVSSSCIKSKPSNLNRANQCRRMLQFNQGKKTKKVLGLREDAEKTFIIQLDMAVDKVTSSKHINDFTINQGMLSFGIKKTFG